MADTLRTSRSSDSLKNPSGLDIESSGGRVDMKIYDPRGRDMKGYPLPKGVAALTFASFSSDETEPGLDEGAIRGDASDEEIRDALTDVMGGLQAVVDGDLAMFMAPGLGTFSSAESAQAGLDSLSEHFAETFPEMFADGAIEEGGEI